MQQEETRVEKPRKGMQQSPEQSSRTFITKRRLLGGMLAALATLGAFWFGAQHGLNAAHSTPTRRTVEQNSPTVQWLQDHGIFRDFLRDELGNPIGLVVELRAATGVEIPPESFVTEGLRFNEHGEVVEILSPTSTPTTNQCSLFILTPSDHPRQQLFVCVGDCVTPEVCTMLIDLSTLVFACACEGT